MVLVGRMRLLSVKQDNDLELTSKILRDYETYWEGVKSYYKRVEREYTEVKIYEYRLDRLSKWSSSNVRAVIPSGQEIYDKRYKNA